MSELTTIPLFPLSLLPLPGELVPLHIFEPRYRELLHDAEISDVHFGIYCSHELNHQRLGSLMKLESVIKKYPSGESDIVVRCVDVFAMDKMLRNFRNKMYPGAEVTMWHVDGNEMPGPEVYNDFLEYQQKRKIHNHHTVFNIYQVGIELNLDLFERYKFLISSRERKLSFLSSQLRYQIHLLDQEEKSKNLYHLN